MDLATIWELAQSPVVITAIASLVLLGLNALYARKPVWRKFEGTIVAAIKYAEKKIPNDTENKGLRRLDEALRYTLDVMEAVNGKRASKKQEHEVREAIILKHDEIDGKDNLRG